MKPARVTLKNGQPNTLGGVHISLVLDTYQAWPRWWLGYQERYYYVVQVEARIVEVFNTKEGWFYSARTFD